MTVFAYATLGRWGLGNKLFPWARAEVFCKKNSGKMLAPRWFALQIGPFIRGERDKRLYAGQFTSEGYVRGWRKLAVLATARRYPEDRWGKSSPARSRPSLVIFEGQKRQDFSPILGFHHYLASRLASILRDDVRSSLRTNSLPDRYLSIHIRRGDFQPAPPNTDFGNATNVQLPIEWYVRTLQTIRQSVSDPIPAVVFSDGSDDELAPVLSLHNVIRAPRAPAVVDLLRLSQGKVLIATGSSFSTWASFLGQMPTIWHVGQLKRSVTQAEFEARADGAILQTSATAVLNAAWQD